MYKQKRLSDRKKNPLAQRHAYDHVCFEKADLVKSEVSLLITRIKSKF